MLKSKDHAQNIDSSGALDLTFARWRGLADGERQIRSTSRRRLDLGRPPEGRLGPNYGTEIRTQSRRPISTQSWVRRRSAMLMASQIATAVSAMVKANAAMLASMR